MTMLVAYNMLLNREQIAKTLTGFSDTLFLL